MNSAVIADDFKIIKRQNYNLLILSGEVADEKAEVYLTQTLPEIINSELDLIVNCNYLRGLSRGWLRALSVTEQSLRGKKKSLRLIMVSQKIQFEFSTGGLSRILKTSKNLRDALLSLGLVNKNFFDVDFINPFLSATVEVLKVLANVEAKGSGSIFMKKDTDLSGDISGIIGLVSESFTGNVIITFPQATFLNLMTKIYKESFTEITKENSDGAGEICNMIFGQAKIILNGQGYGMKTALPTIVIGKCHSFSSQSQGPIVVVPFESECGGFFIEIGISDIEAAAS